MSRTDLPRERFGDEALVTEYAELLTYERDAGFDRAMPDAVLLAPGARAVEELVEWCRQNNRPVVARGAGTGLSGGALAVRGGIVVSLERLRGLAVEPGSRLARVEAGVPVEQVDAAARCHGLFYPPDPSSGRSSVIGGNIATNAGGPHCFKYGVTANYVRSVEVVLADGRRQVLGELPDAPGYDLRSVVVGSEGTLAIVTAAVLELRREPPGVRTLMVSFERLARAGEAVSALIATGLEPAAIEAIDQRGMQVIESYREVGLPVEAGAALIVEVDGYPESLDRQTRDVSDLLTAHGGTVLRVARTEEERREIWFARKSAAGALAHLAPSYYLTDITVRRSRLAPVLERVREICDRHGLETASFFHAGDGNLHPLIPCDQSDRETMRRVHRAVEEIIDLCTSEGGSITGEHGVGLEKVPFMHRMYGAAELTAMRDVKRAFDPDGLLNPGKVLPDEVGEIEEAPAGELPDGHFRPASAVEAAGTLARLGAEGIPVEIRGGDARGEGGENGEGIILSTCRLAGIRELAADDLFVSVGAGTTVEELARRVDERGLAVRLVAPWPEATIGGLLARNLNPPSRILHGSLRDGLLAAVVVLADGRVLELGRPLVKNVAGYDLHRLFVGSRGALGLLTEVTLKLEPASETVRTLEVSVEGWAAAQEAAGMALKLALVSSGLVIVPRGADGELVVRHSAAGLVEDVRAELAAVRRSWEAIGDVGETPTTADSSWADLTRAAAGSLLIRIGVQPTHLGRAARSVRRVGGELLVDWGSSLVWGVVPVDDTASARQVMHDLRAEIDSMRGYVVLVEALAGICRGVGRQPEPPGVEIMRRLEKAWDPAGILEGGWRP